MSARTIAPAAPREGARCVLGLQHFQPLGAGRTRMVRQLFEARRSSDATLSAGVLTEMAQQAAQFFRDVFAEDKASCEQVQLGLRDAEQPGVLSEKEERVGRFQTAYHQLMGEIPAVIADELPGAGWNTGC